MTLEKTRLYDENQQAVEHTIELKEQVDAALGADQMVSVLTQKNLDLEDKIEKIMEEHKDLVSCGLHLFKYFVFSGQIVDIL